MTILEQVKGDYEKWNTFLENEIDFWLKTSEKHTKEHCSRVLLFCLLIADKRELPQRETDILCMAAVFHDSCRQDDWYDVGHGQRAADYYRSYCEKTDLTYDDRTYYIIAYHDRDDELSVRILREKFPDDPDAVLLYQIFKDADALDRFRLGPDALDAKYLRTLEAKNMVEFAKRLLWD